MKAPGNGLMANTGEGERKSINSELWHACAGPLVSLPPVGSLVVYFPQGHSEQVAASMRKETNGYIPNYPNLPPKLICMLHNVTLHADPETDEVYAQMTLQPVSKHDMEALMASDMGLKQSKQPAEFFCKTLTASDTSTHGGFSVPRRAAEKIFPPLDFTMQPPAQQIVAGDLHDVAWTFRHIYRGQPKRHLLTTGWSVFISTKRLFTGDSVLFIRDEKSQLLLGLKRANRQQPALSSSVLSSDSMHIGILAAAAHAAANNSPFTIFYNPRASPSEFVIPLAKYKKAMYTQVSPGMRFRMMFETEESGVRRYMGTITGISDLDPAQWKNSQWRNLQVGWDESTAGERQTHVSVWEIEPVVTPFYICPPPFFRPNCPRQPGMPDDESEIENAFKRALPWLSDDFEIKDAQSPLLPGLSLVQWMSMQQRNSQLLGPLAQSDCFPSMASMALRNLGTDDPSKHLNFQAQSLPFPNLQYSISKLNQQSHQVDQFQQPQLPWPQHQQQKQQQSFSHQNPQQTQVQNPVLQQNLIPSSQLQQQKQQQSFADQTPTQTQIQNQVFQQNLIQSQLQQLQKQQQCFSNQTLLQTQIQNQNLQQNLAHSQLQQQRFLLHNQQLQQNTLPSNQNPVQSASLPENLQLQQQGEQQQSLTQRQQQQPQQLLVSQQQLQLHLLQKLQQQQQQQLLSQISSHLSSQPQQQHQAHQQSLQFQQNQAHQQLQQFTGSQQIQPQQKTSQQEVQLANKSAQPLPFSSDPLPTQHKSPLPTRANSGLTDGDAPSYSTSPSTNNCHISPNFFSKTHQVADETVQSANNLVQEQSKIKHELPISKEPDPTTLLAYQSANSLDASSSATSFCLDVSIPQNFHVPSYQPSPLLFREGSQDGEVQNDPRNNLLFGVNIDGLLPDALLSRGFGSGKDLQNLLSGYGSQRDVETELSTATTSSRSFGVPDMFFRPGSSSEAAISDSGVINRGLCPQQPQRIRTYTKVQKRGSVGRTIDVTRYKGYDELRHDLACMFGIEGRLEDPHRTDWKLVYVDHENDILLVGDDPWEEFVSCVESIKILSPAEVQQMSLDGDLLNMPLQNQVCSGGSDSGNVWRGHCDDNSAASFER